MRLGIALLAMGLLLAGCEKYALDRQMEELCKKDGGVRVYESVTLPPEMFDQWGDPFPGWRGAEPEKRFGPEYRYLSKTTYLKRGSPFKLFSEGELVLLNEKIVRTSDEKLLGEATVYVRVGGETILLGHPSSKRCPAKYSSRDLIRAVFNRGGL